MTRYLDPLGEHAAVRRAHALLGDEALERITNKSASLARHWADPDMDGHHIQFRQALALDCALAREGRETPFLSCLQAAVRSALPAVPMAVARPKTIGESLAEIGREFGEFAGVVFQSMKDKRLTVAEKKRLNKELDDIIDRAKEAKRALR